MRSQKTHIKILDIAPYCIDPADTGGKIRVREIVNGLASAKLDITVAMPATPATFLGKIINPCLKLETVRYPFLLPLLFTGRPFSYHILMSLHPGYRRLLQKWIKDADMIQFEGASFGDLAKHLPRSKTVIYDAHNVEAEYAESEHRIGWARNIAVKRMHQLEAQLANRADLILTCSRTDADRLNKRYRLAGKKCIIIPNGIHSVSPKCNSMDAVAKGIASQSRRYALRVLFSGSNAAHNQEAVQFLLESLAPRLEGQCAIIIQGQCGLRYLKKGKSNTFFDTRPGDAGRYAHICTAALNPVIHGSGTSLKLLDYLACGLPVISTPFGMRGYEDLHPYVTIAERHKFAQAFAGRPAWHTGTQQALEKYSWNSIASYLAGVYRSMMAEKRSNL